MSLLNSQPVRLQYPRQLPASLTADWDCPKEVMLTSFIGWCSAETYVTHSNKIIVFCFQASLAMPGPVKYTMVMNVQQPKDQFASVFTLLLLADAPDSI
jgi:hypothetical protein